RKSRPNESLMLERCGAPRLPSSVFGALSQVLKLFFQFLELVLGHLFQVDQLITCAFQCADKLVKLQMDHLGVAVLSVLNQKHHEKGHKGGRGVDNELPGIGKMKRGPGDEPDDDDNQRTDKCPRAAKNHRRSSRERVKCIGHATKQIS